MNAALWPRLKPALPAMVLSAVVLQLLFHTEIAAAVHVWNSSTAYGHCWLVLPIAFFLLYDRRDQAAAVVMAPRPMFACLAMPLVLIWLMADLLGIMEGRQLALIGFVEVLLLAALGVRLWTTLSGAFLYLVFLVPFGAFITPALQGFTAAFIVHGLDLLGIANHASGNVIEIHEGTFYVAEACAGLRFLVASIAFGVLYALIMFTAPWRRAAFIAMACIVPVIANGLRALGIVILGHVLGSAQAAATDHILYGWLFFALVIAAMAALGMPFRQDAPPPPPPGPWPAPGAGMRAIYAVWPVLLIAALGPMSGMALTAHAVPAPPPSAAFTAAPGCTQTITQTARDLVEQAFTCGTTRLTGRTLRVPRRADPSRVLALWQTEVEHLLPGADLETSALKVNGTHPSFWMLQQDARSGRVAASVLFIDGKPASGGLHDRIRLAREMLAADAPSPLIVSVAVTQAAGDPAHALSDFLAGQANLADRLENVNSDAPPH
jgi:exosortase A